MLRLIKEMRKKALDQTVQLNGLANQARKQLEKATVLCQLANIL